VNLLERQKYALVTGGGRGIGRSIVERLAEDGYNVAFTCRNSVDGANELAQKLTAMGSDTIVIRADVSKLDEVQAAFDQYAAHYDRLDLLVNNAGATIGGRFLEMSPERFEACVNTDFRGPYFMSQRAARFMIEKDCKGSIVNIASNQGTAVFQYYSIYGSGKAALIKLTKHMALELAPYGIRVNSVSPGFTNVGWAYAESTEYRKLQKIIPIGGFGRPEDIAGIVSFLSSDTAKYITGIDVAADGGAMLPVVTDTPSTWIPDSILEEKED
jgi:NAD(P)-dependent dehydrogenase (short-subunit alcohol dehydrogenase family)